MSKRKTRILLAKAGLDGHDRGILTIAMACKESGMEVIYGGLHLTPQAIAAMAVQEGVDIIGISSLSDAHMTLVPMIIKELHAQGADDIPVILGGFIQPDDIPELKAKGITEVFGIGASLDAVTSFIEQTVARKRN